MTKSALAHTSGIALSSVTMYEAAQHTPSERVVEEFARILAFPSVFFYAPDFDLLEDNAPTFRSRRAMGLRLRLKALGYGQLAIHSISPELNRRYSLPSVDLLDLAREAPENAAAALRSHWRLGQYPISNMTHLLESKGIEIYWLNENSPTLDAFAVQHGNKPFILVNMHDRAGDRDRMNLAHELGHLVLHHDKDRIEGLDVESEAFRFAGAFLMPPEAFRIDCPRYPVLEQFARLKKKWGVSVAAMVRRARDLNILTERQYKSASIEITVQGWRKKEPASIALPNEESLMHRKIFENMATKNLTPLHFANQLDISVADLCVLMPTAQLIQGEIGIPQHGLRLVL